MSKLIKLTDNTYNELKQQANSGGRSLAGQIAYLLKGIPNDDMAESVGAIKARREPCCNMTRPCKHWIWDVQLGDGYINTLTGEKKEA